MNDLEQRLQSLCVGSTHGSDSCVAAIREHLEAGGARLRAKICLHAGLQLELGTGDAMQLAACCELLHNASLVQDDLLDRTALRRGRQSIWAAHGDVVALCAGDLMLSAAYAAIGFISKTDLLPSALALVHTRAREAMLGQVAESHRGPELGNPFDAYQRLAIGKSASLLRLSLELPLLLAGRGDTLPIARVAAESFAIAYQIADDLDDQVEDAREGLLNIVSLLEHDGLLSRTQAEHAAATRALASLVTSMTAGRNLPLHCAAVLIASAESLQSRLSDVVCRSCASVSLLG